MSTSERFICIEVFPPLVDAKYKDIDKNTIDAVLSRLDCLQDELDNAQNKLKIAGDEISQLRTVIKRLESKLSAVHSKDSHLTKEEEPAFINTGVENGICDISQMYYKTEWYITGCRSRSSNVIAWTLEAMVLKKMPGLHESDKNMLMGKRVRCFDEDAIYENGIDIGSFFVLSDMAEALIFEDVSCARRWSKNINKVANVLAASLTHIPSGNGNGGTLAVCSYVDALRLISRHPKINGRQLEAIIAYLGCQPTQLTKPQPAHMQCVVQKECAIESAQHTNVNSSSITNHIEATRIVHSNVEFVNDLWFQVPESVYSTGGGSGEHPQKLRKCDSKKRVIEHVNHAITDCDIISMAEWDKKKQETICSCGKLTVFCKLHGGSGLCVVCKDARFASCYDKHCVDCFVYNFPADARSLCHVIQPENLVRAAINFSFKGFIHNKVIPTTSMSHMRRIDHRLLIGNTILAVETDENAHRNYNKYDENHLRYHDFVSQLPYKFIFIRFNPHANMESLHAKTDIIHKIQILMYTITTHIDRIQKGRNVDRLEGIKLFY